MKKGDLMGPNLSIDENEIHFSFEPLDDADENQDPKTACGCDKYVAAVSDRPKVTLDKTEVTCPICFNYVNGINEYWKRFPELQDIYPKEIQKIRDEQELNAGSDGREEYDDDGNPNEEE